jgi:uncharacterized protein (TIGR03067 family)
MRPLLAFALLVGLAPAAPVPKALKKADDKSLLLGQWKTTSEAGNTGKVIWTHTYQFEDTGRLKQRFGEDGLSEWDWTIDPEPTPKRMRWVNRSDAKVAFDGVYELDGDTLRINYVSANSPLPRGLGLTADGYAVEMTRDTTRK